MIAKGGFGPAANIGIMFLAWSVWAALWQSRYWDIKVAPEHNIEAWQVIALTASTLVMHFPAPNDD